MVSVSTTEGILRKIVKRRRNAVQWVIGVSLGQGLWKTGVYGAIIVTLCTQVLYLCICGYNPLTGT